jgi:hypothetical protein
MLPNASRTAKRKQFRARAALAALPGGPVDEHNGASLIWDRWRSPWSLTGSAPQITEMEYE